MASVTARTATDNFSVASGSTTTGADTISVSNQNQINSGDLFDGDAGFDTLRTTTSANFTGILNTATSGIKHIEQLLYTGADLMTFRSDQFGNGLISNALNVTGTTGTQQLTVTMSPGGSLDMSGWTWTSWTSGTDLVTVNGSTIDDVYKAGSVGSTFAGGTGQDTIDFSGQSGDITLTLNGATNATAKSTTGVSYVVNTVENVVGSSANDTITGDGAANVITGGAGNDTLSGGGGDDVFILGAGFGTDTIVGGETTEAFGDSIDASAFTGKLTLTMTGAESGTLSDGTNTVTFSEIENIYLGGGANTITASGLKSAITLRGQSANDTLIGGSGADMLIGDSNILINGSFEVGFAANTYATTAITGWKNASGDSFEVWGSGFNGEVSADGTNFIEIDNGRGLDTAYQDVATEAGKTYNLTFSANQRESGNDTIEVWWNGKLLDTVTPKADWTNYTYSVSGSGGIARLEFRELASQNDSLGVMLDKVSLTANGNDSLDGGAGADTLIGGAGSDTYYVDNVGDVVVDRSTDAGTDLVYSSVTFAATGTNQDGVDNITLTGATNINATGNALANIIIGNAGNNVLNGGDGNDTLTGGLGNDTLIGGANADRFIYDAQMMTAQLDVVSDFSVAQGDQIDLGTFGPASWEVLQDHLLFVDGTNNAYLAGKWNGTDQLLTLSGVDVSTISAAQFVFDTSGTARNISGTANEDRIFGGLGNDTIYGGGGHDRLFGDAGDDLIYGEAGNDRIYGNSGNDTVYGGDGNDQIYGGDGNDMLDAGSGNNHLDGGAGNDILIGGTGNDNIIGGTGADTMTGGAGADTYFVYDAGDVVNESASDAGRDWVFSSISINLGGTAAGVENATLEGTANINLTGNALANFLYGNSGNNVLDGGDGDDTLNGGDGNDTLIGGNGNDRLAGDAGADTMTGGAGNDIYEVDHAGDIVNEAVGDGGVDSVNTSISFSLTGTADGVEKATLLGSGDFKLTGNGLANTLTGNAGDNVLDGGDGNDRLIGGDGNDTLEGGNGLDTLEGGNGTDILNGGAGNDRLFGGAGNDTLNGGTGSDSLFGETGADTFVFDGAFGRDTIADFNASEDRLDLTSFGIDTAAELMPFATNSGTNMLITLGTGNVITIQNFSVDQIHNGMFVV